MLRPPNSSPSGPVRSSDTGSRHSRGGCECFCLHRHAAAAPPHNFTQQRTEACGRLLLAVGIVSQRHRLPRCESSYRPPHARLYPPPSCARRIRTSSLPSIMSDTLAKLQSMRWDYPAVAVAQVGCCCPQREGGGILRVIYPMHARPARGQAAGSTPVPLRNSSPTPSSTSSSHPPPSPPFKPVAVDDRNSVQTCKRCALPIQIFGRVMPCRHAFCFLCAKKKATETCPHCGNKVEQIDRLEGPYALIICQIPSASDVPCNRGYRNIQDLATHQIKNHSSAARAKSAGGSERRSSPSAAPSKG